MNMNLTRSLATLLTLSAIATTPLAGMSTNSISTSDNATASVSSTNTATPKVETISVTSTEKDEDSKNSDYDSDCDKETLAKWTATDDFGRNSICSWHLPFVFGQMLKKPTFEAMVLEGLKKRFQANLSTYLGDRDQLIFLIAACQYAPEFAIELTRAITETLAVSFFNNGSFGCEWNVDLMGTLTDTVIKSTKLSPVNLAVFDECTLKWCLQDVYLPSKYKNDEQRKRLEATATCLALIQVSVAKMTKDLALEVQKLKEYAPKAGISDSNNKVVAYWLDRNTKAMTALQDLTTKCATEQKKLSKEISAS